MKNPSVVSQMVVKMLWAMGEEFDNNENISCLITDVAKKCDFYSDESILREVVMEGLKEMSEVYTTEKEMVFGYTNDIGGGVYWWDNNAETRWVIDEPDWWQTAIQDTIKDSIWQTYNSLSSSVYEGLDETCFVDVLLDAFQTSTIYKSYDPEFAKQVATEIYNSHE